MLKGIGVLSHLISVWPMSSTSISCEFFHWNLVTSQYGLSYWQLLSKWTSTFGPLTLLYYHLQGTLHTDMISTSPLNKAEMMLANALQISEQFMVSQFHKIGCNHFLLCSVPEKHTYYVMKTHQMTINLATWPHFNSVLWHFFQQSMSINCSFLTLYV